jgi:hypothetical protein
VGAAGRPARDANAGRPSAARPRRERSPAERARRVRRSCGSRPPGARR